MILPTTLTWPPRSEQDVMYHTQREDGSYVPMLLDPLGESDWTKATLDAQSKERDTLIARGFLVE